MIRPGRALLACVLAATAGLAMAQDRPQPGAAQGQSSASKQSLRHYVTGTLVAFDVEKGTVTFKDESGKRLTWPIEVRLAEYARAYATMRLQTLKEGDHVMVIYAGDAAVEPRVYDVKPFNRRSAGRQGPEGKDQPAAAPASPAPPQ
jgi:Cu/Ag efflux protein CusF